jgi:RNA polymerase sigma-70 factor (ECF subfamily)
VFKKLRIANPNDPITEMGGVSADFPATSDRMTGDLQSILPHKRQAAMEDLCRRYWKPVYAYLRSRWGKSNEDAKDVTQAFFTWLTEGDALQSYQPAQGPFRKYLKTLLVHFEGHLQESRRRLKRGNGRKHLSFESDTIHVPSDDPEPAAAFDNSWRSLLIERALHATRRHYVKRDRQIWWHLFESHDLCPDKVRPTYDDLARRMGIRRDHVRNHLHAVREEVRFRILTELAETVQNARELQEEWKDLIGDFRVASNALKAFRMPSQPAED